VKEKGLSRRFIGGWLVLFLAVILVAVGCPPPRLVEPPVELPPVEPEPVVFEWRMQTFAPARHPLMVNSQDFFAQLVAKLSDGRLIIHSYGAGEIVAAQETRAAVTERTIEMGMWWPGLDLDVHPVAAILGTMPFGIGQEDYLAWWMRGGGKELMAEFYAPLNVYPVGVFVEAGGPVLHMVEPWSTLEELKGRTFAVAGLQAKIFELLGIGTVLVPGDEICRAMEIGLIDGAKWGSPIMNKELGIHEVGPYMLLPAWHEPALLGLFIVNKDAWAELPDDLKYIVEVAALATYTHYRHFTLHQNAHALNYMLAAGARIITLPEDDLAILRATAMKILQEYAAKSEFFARVLKSMLDYLEFRAPFKEFAQF
jgi:TRAP-type mannitol/chloroaromatic compound transport system substrate-binding protein